MMRAQCVRTRVRTCVRTYVRTSVRTGVRMTRPYVYVEPTYVHANVYA